MSIRFACTNCRQKLAISTRKAGTRVTCPKCHAEVTVPQSVDFATQSPALTSLSGATSRQSVSSIAANKSPAAVAIQPPVPPAVKAPAAKPRTASQAADKGRPSFSSLNLDVIISPGAATAAQIAPPVLSLEDVPAVDVAAAAPKVLQVELPAVAASRGTPVVVDPSLVAVSRGLLYVQAAVLVALAVLAFGLGYWTGRAVSPATEEALAALSEPVPIEGDFVYRAADGADVPDAGASVVLLPQQRAPRDRLPIEGLRPQDVLEEDQLNPAILSLENEGGAYARVTATGQFWLKAKPGRYWVLAISANATRPNNALPRVRDVSLLGKYFERAADLLENRRYRLIEVQFPQDNPLELALD